MREINTQDKRFIDGNGRDVLGTVVTADWLNAVQDELVGLIRGFGAQVAPGTPNQIYQLVSTALNSMASNRVIINAGSGIIGGGDLTSSRMLSLGIPSTLTDKTTNATTSNSHTHELARASTTAAGIVRLNNTLISDATDQALTAAQGKALNEAKLDVGALKYTHKTVPGSSTVYTLDFGNRQSLIDLMGSDYVGNGHFETTLHNSSTSHTLINAPLDGVRSTLHLTLYLMGAHSFMEVVYLSSGRRFYSAFNFGMASWAPAWIELISTRRLTDATNVDDPTIAASARALKLVADGAASAGTVITAGNGLTGGGSLGANRTITLGTPSTITGTTGNTTTTTSHTHAIQWATTGVAGVVQLSTATNSSATNMAATPSAVKAAYDQAAAKVANLSNGTNALGMRWDNSRIFVRVDNTDFPVATTADVAAAMPPGTVIYFAGLVPPNGFLKCNGAQVSRATYAGIFAAIGTTYGAGNGSTTFNLPDLRGEFIRGYDDGRTVDNGRVLGSWQADELRWHDHIYRRGHLSNSVAWERVEARRDSSASLYDGDGRFDDPGDRVSTAAFGGVETRPRNLALLACIKI